MDNLEKKHIVKRTLKGLHRPFNKPLKSLYWVCRFAEKCSEDEVRAFYVSFYLFYLNYISSSDTQYEKLSQKEGMVSPEDARTVLRIQKECPLHFSERVNKVLYERKDDIDRLLYRTYKNTSYYISLAKKIGVLTQDYHLTSDGERLLKSTNKMYILTDAEKRLYFEWILDSNFELFVTLLLVGYSDKSRMYQRFLEQNGSSQHLTKFIRSYDKNYVEVLRSWIEQLNILTKRGTIRSCYIRELKRLELFSRYNDLAVKYGIYKNTVELGRSKQQILFDRFDDAYKKLVKKGIADAGFVNLYDIRDILRMSYERFNSLLTDYYVNRKFNQIILFSNIVSSIDTRRRFVVENQIVLKIKLIQKKKSNGYE